MLMNRNTDVRNELRAPHHRTADLARMHQPQANQDPVTC
jgi:hypothetical protein